MLKIGLSSYSLSKAINAGEMDILGAIKGFQRTAENTWNSPQGVLSSPEMTP